jgi:hypothetical protein
MAFGFRGRAVADRSMSVRQTKVYIAAPYSKGIPDEIFVRVIEAAERLSELGYVPFIPHTMTFMWALRYQHPVHFWYAFDLHWLEDCHALLRLPGESRGADAEAARAEQLGLPVFHSLADLHHGIPPRRTVVA